MSLPSFSAEHSLYAGAGSYRTSFAAAGSSNDVVPAIPACDNCDAILDRCGRNGGRPRAVCHACAAGRCYTEGEAPDPYPDPFPHFPRF